MREIFWLALAIVAYVYAGYPAILWLWTRLRTREHALEPSDVQLPGVSIVIAARNEARRLPARIDNLLDVNYPAARRQIIVVSDGSTDDTQTVLARYAGIVEVVTVPAGGKALALNAGVAHAANEILVFADARQVFAPDALIELTRPFGDPSVGGVTGELLLDCETPSADDRRRHDRRGAEPDGLVAAERRRRERRGRVQSTISDGVGLYWRYEKSLRRLESRLHSTLGATGCIYALRRHLWKPLPAGTVLDDVLAPMRAVMSGARVLFNERARAFDRTSAHADAEAKRKVRTLAGNYQILWLEPALLLPWRNRVWAQYVSHKLGRLVVPYALLAIFFTSIALSATAAFYAWALGVQVAFYLLAGYGAWLDLRDRGHGVGASRGGAGQPAREAA